MTNSPVRSLQIDFRPVERLIPFARNARTHSNEQIAQLAGSIKEFGFNNPVLIDPEGSIIAGHGRVLAARKLGLSEIPVLVLAHLTDNQKRAFRLADNKLALNAGWDLEMLRLELEALAEQDLGLEKLVGFSDLELKELAGAVEHGFTDADEVPEPLPRVISITGDIWTLGRHRLLCGDGTCHLDVERVLDKQRCGMSCSDFPYDVNYIGKTRRRMKMVNDNLGEAFGDFLKAACKVILAVSQGAIYISMSSSELHRLHTAFTECGGHWSTYIIWAKNTFTLGRSDFQRQYEPMLYGWREGVKHYWCGARDQGDVWFIDKPRVNDLHPTMKPVALVERAIENSSLKGDVVLDTFAGSGTTLIACETTGRTACLVEIDPRYVDVIVRRWQAFTGRQANLGNDHRTFDQVAAERTERS